MNVGMASVVSQWSALEENYDKLKTKKIIRKYCTHKQV